MHTQLQRNTAVHLIHSLSQVHFNSTVQVAVTSISNYQLNTSVHLVYADADGGEAVAACGEGLSVPEQNTLAAAVNRYLEARGRAVEVENDQEIPRSVANMDSYIDAELGRGRRRPGPYWPGQRGQRGHWRDSSFDDD